MKFNCQNGTEKWQGEIKNYREFGSHYLLQVSAKGSGILRPINANI
ncbi:hypothetical protein ERICIV_00456 [Paenibacillus larvae subsp. larvae]|uniref:Uncharacterized protein n=1 Tax=Paenibacillus larvae subsp. larvae TaxID=147375 RepID=A0A2L1U962_9BACL|nr:hypothetical protein ERICIII_00456 [Paenibacillus larvae subsp. larvae]AVF29451.1 hypothetical protein ERICIV_00456 [Paenibacillus larvae subsp. larvae]